MALSPDNSPVPVKVRGKRRAIAAEKYPTGKGRRPGLQKRPENVQSTSAQSSLKLRKRKRKTPEDASPLESLPAEVLQQVFEYSANIELPLVSRELATKLSRSSHLQNKLTSQVLKPVLGTVAASSKALGEATRLLDSRFMTWKFFTRWLQARGPPMAACDASGDVLDIAEARVAWLSLQPSTALLPPKKLLSSPFNEEKAQFLAVLCHNIRDLPGMDSSYGELGREALAAAIRQEMGEVVRMLLSMGIAVTTESIRVAVTEAGCNEEIVDSLIDNISSRFADVAHHDDSGFDALDPALWGWAEEAERKGNRKGRWLLRRLQDMHQQREGLANA